MPSIALNQGIPDTPWSRLITFIIPQNRQWVLFAQLLCQRQYITPDEGPNSPVKINKALVGTGADLA